MKIPVIAFEVGIELYSLSQSAHSNVGVEGLKCLLCLQATAAGEAFVHKVVHILRPKVEPIEDAARAGSLQTKIQATPASAPPTAPSQTAPAVEKQVQWVLMTVSSCCVIYD